MIAVLLAIGTIFYSEVEKLSLLDAFYLAGTTITTLGIGDFSPQTGAGKIFTVLYTLVGIGTLFFVLGKVFHIVLTKTFIDPLFHDQHYRKRKKK